MLKSSNSLPAGTALEKKVIDYAEDLGRLIGSVRARVDDWKGERDKLAQQLSSVVKEAQQLLTDLGQSTSRKGRRLVVGAATRARATAAELAPEPNRGLRR